MPGVKKGSIEDVSATGTRDIGGRGIGNWYSTESEMKEGKGISMEIERSVKFINDPMVTEYVNRIGQNIVKNSDAKVPFTIRVIDSDEINAMALPGGFFYVNSDLILAASFIHHLRPRHERNFADVHIGREIHPGLSRQAARAGVPEAELPRRGT